MDEKQFKDVLDEFHKAESIVRIGGVKGEVLHPFIRQVVENYRFKRLQKRETTITKNLEELKRDIEQHLVVKSEKAEYNVIRDMIKEYVMLYFTLHSMHLFERDSLQRLAGDIDAFKKMLHNTPNPEVKKAIENIIDGWKDELENERKLINSTWHKAIGGTGWAGTLFQTLHNEGFFTRRKERVLFKQAVKDKQLIEKEISKLAGHPSIDGLKKTLKEITDKEKEMAQDYKVLWRFLTSTWDHVGEYYFGDKEGLFKQVLRAVGLHELPQRDAAQVEQIANLFKHLDEKLLHGLRIEVKQLEAEEEADLKRAG